MTDELRELLELRVPMLAGVGDAGLLPRLPLLPLPLYSTQDNTDYKWADPTLITDKLSPLMATLIRKSTL